MNDLTVIMLTANKVPEQWAQYHKEMLLKTIEDTPLITVSYKPLDFGINLIQTEYSLTNIFKQMLRAAKIATTEYIAMADDDTLYPKEHFEYRPKGGHFAYNLTRWHLFTWGRPYYFHKPRPGNGLMITNRRMLISAITSRLNGHDELPGFLLKEFATKESTAKYDIGKLETFYTIDPVVSFYHRQSIDPLNQRRRKAPWPVRALELPLWGRAKDLRNKWK